MKKSKMVRILGISLLAITIVACKQGTPESGENQDGTVQDLQNQVDQLTLDNAMKDSIINESLAFFNEIKANLEAIGIRKDEIRDLSQNDEVSSEDKQWIIEEIKHINYLREENANNLRRLQAEMKKNNVKINELEIMIETLMKDIQWKDEQIALLQTELDNLDKEYAALFDAYQEQAIELNIMEHELNAVHYAYGTDKELIDNGVIDKKNGFLGIGRKMSLKEDFNDDYFTKIDATKKKSIFINGSGDVRFITYHPKSSYTFEEQGSGTRIKILDASEFWKISKYLVVIVD